MAERLAAGAVDLTRVIAAGLLAVDPMQVIVAGRPAVGHHVVGPMPVVAAGPMQVTVAARLAVVIKL